MGTRKIVDIRKNIVEEIESKYEFFIKSDFKTVANMSLDSMFPYLFKHRYMTTEPAMSIQRFPVSSFAISEFVANTMNVRKAHISELCEILGYTEKNIKDILLAVKRQKLNLILTGLGGTGMNFNYFASEMCNWTNTVNIFKEISVYDNDKYSISNLIRIPFDFRSRAVDHEKTYSFINTPSIGSRMKIYDYFISLEAALRLGNLDRTIFYGAPNIRTRQDFADNENIKFISATHGGDDCSLYLNPPQDDSLQIETYGRINLSIFFMNHLKMTIQFFEFIANFETVNWQTSGEIMEYNFKNVYNNDGIGRTKRLYRFPCMTREEEEAISERNALAFGEDVAIAGTFTEESDEALPFDEVEVEDDPIDFTLGVNNENEVVLVPVGDTRGETIGTRIIDDPLGNRNISESDNAILNEISQNISDMERKFRDSLIYNTNEPNTTQAMASAHLVDDPLMDRVLRDSMDLKRVNSGELNPSMADMSDELINQILETQIDEEREEGE
jgi:hypothetical protein